MEEVVDRIEPEPVQPPIEPEFAGVQDGVDHLGVMIVQVRLRPEEVVQVVLPTLRIKFPSWSTKVAVPIRGGGYRRAMDLPKHTNRISGCRG